MKKIPLTQGKFAIVDDDDFERLNCHKWHLSSQGYARRFDGGRKKQSCIYMHRVIINTPNNLLTDHINGNKLDNRKSNLRVCNNSQNVANRSLMRNNTSGLVGVSYTNKNKTNPWVAKIKIDNKRIHIGYFRSKKEAHAAYSAISKIAKGEFYNEKSS